MAARAVALLSVQGEAVPRALSSPSGRWAASFTSCSRLTGLAAEGRWVSSLPIEGARPLPVIAMTPPQPLGIWKKGQAVSKELLWQEFFSDPSQWWDNRFEKENPSSPDFRHKRTQEALWIDGCSNPAWVNAELSTMVQGRTQSGAHFLVDAQHGSPGCDHNGMAGSSQGLNQFGTSTMTTVSESGQKVGVHKNSPDTCGDLMALCKAGQLKEALRILNQPGISVDSNTYVFLLQECIKMKNLAGGKQLHAHIMHNVFKPKTSLVNTLVNMYAKCRSVVHAREVFDQMPERDVSTFTIMMAGYVKHGSGREACKIYEQMIQEGVKPNRVTFICALNACASLGDLDKGKEVHAQIVSARIAPDIILETALADMYAKSGSMKDARQVFDKMAERNVVSWSAMIGGYAQHGCGREALDMYEQMTRAGVSPNRVTFICLLKACGSEQALEKGKEVHADIIKSGIAPDVILETALVDMYAKCGSVEDALEVFDKMSERNVVSWSVMITANAQNGCGMEALDMYEQMIREGVMPNQVTFIGVLNACASLGALDKGRKVHADISKSGISTDINLENTLVDMYAKCGSLKDASDVFDQMAEQDVVSWNVMIAGYSQHGYGREAYDTYERMIWKGISPDRVTFICVLNACASIGALEIGKRSMLIS